MSGTNRLRLVAASLALALAASACGSGSGSGSRLGEAGLDLLDAGTLRVCSDVPFAPFEFEDDQGRFTGYDIEIVRAIAADLELTLEVQPTPFDGILGAPEAGECDLVASALIVTDERAEQVDFTDPYYMADQSLLVAVADEGLTLADMAGRTIGVQAGTTGEVYAEESSPGEATIVALDGASELLAAIEAGEIDAIIQDAPVNELWAAEYDTLMVAEVLETGETYAFAVKAGNTGLLAAVNEGLAALEADGQLDTLFARFFGQTG